MVIASRHLHLCSLLLLLRVAGDPLLPFATSFKEGTADPETTALTIIRSVSTLPRFSMGVAEAGRDRDSEARAGDRVGTKAGVAGKEERVVAREVLVEVLVEVEA